MYKMIVIEPISTGKIKPGLRPFDFKESGVLRDQIILKEGEINVTTLALDDETPELELSFRGSGGPLTDFKKELSQTMTGTISIEFDNKIDMR